MHSVERHLYPGPERMPSSFSRAMSNIWLKQQQQQKKNKHTKKQIILNKN
jgi:fructose-bisphosphate aldolase class 1